MPEEKRPLKVFLCHAHSDAKAVRTLYNRLITDGVDAWLDKENTFHQLQSRLIPWICD